MIKQCTFSKSLSHSNLQETNNWNYHITTNWKTKETCTFSQDLRSIETLLLAIYETDYWLTQQFVNQWKSSSSRDGKRQLDRQTELAQLCGSAPLLCTYLDTALAVSRADPQQCPSLCWPLSNATLVKRAHSKLPITEKNKHLSGDTRIWPQVLPLIAVQKIHNGTMWPAVLHIQIRQIKTATACVREREIGTTYDQHSTVNMINKTPTTSMTGLGPPRALDLEVQHGLRPCPGRTRPSNQPKPPSCTRPTILKLAEVGTTQQPISEGGGESVHGQKRDRK